MVLGNPDQGSLVPGFIVVNTGSGQLKEPQEKSGGQLLLGLVISHQEEHVQVATYLLVEPESQGLSCHLSLNLFTYLPHSLAHIFRVLMTAYTFSLVLLARKE